MNRPDLRFSLIQPVVPEASQSGSSAESLTRRTPSFSDWSVNSRLVAVEREHPIEAPLSSDACCDHPYAVVLAHWVDGGQMNTMGDAHSASSLLSASGSGQYLWSNFHSLLRPVEVVNHYRRKRYSSSDILLGHSEHVFLSLYRSLLCQKPEATRGTWEACPVRSAYLCITSAGVSPAITR